MPDTNISLPTTLHPNRTKMVLLFLVCAAFVVIAVWTMVAWNFTADYVASGGMCRASKAFSGYEAALPDTYGMKAQELADLLNELRRSYAADGNAG